MLYKNKPCKSLVKHIIIGEDTFANSPASSSPCLVVGRSTGLSTNYPTAFIHSLANSQWQWGWHLGHPKAIYSNCWLLLPLSSPRGIRRVIIFASVWCTDWLRSILISLGCILVAEEHFVAVLQMRVNQTLVSRVSLKIQQSNIVAVVWSDQLSLMSNRPWLAADHLILTAVDCIW